MKGRVIRSTGSWYQVETKELKIYDCKLRGQFKIKGIKSTNPIAVGDWVEFDWEEKRQTAIIHKIEDRHNYIVRRSVNLSKRSHIIAANIDQALLVVTITQPRTSQGFIDRFLVTSEAYHIPCVLVFNKIDIYSKEDKIALQNMKSVYEKIGYQCIEVSAHTGANLVDLKGIMKDQVSLVSGHSGVGKSALINALDPDKDIRIGDISDTHNKGKHTTTFAEMHYLSFGAHIIDSPGIKEFGLFDFDKYQLSHYFPEMQNIRNECKFNNCSHEHEPGCAIKQAVEAHKIDPNRYGNYLNMLRGEDMNLVDYDS